MSVDGALRAMKTNMLLIQTAKDAVDNQPSAKDWGREATRLITEEGHSVEEVIAETKRALGWHHLSGLMDTGAKRSKFNNYFSTLRYLVPAWACGEIPIDTRKDVLRGDASFLSIYASQKKLQKAEATGLKDAIEHLARVRSFAQHASSTVALQLKPEVAILLDLLNHKAPAELSSLRSPRLGA